MSERVADPVYDPIAAFAGSLAALGVRDIVISPGSRSTPLAVTFHAHPDLRTHIQLDERSAGFFALGQARASGRPSVLICTSGTAAANYLPAVVEAQHSCVPMIVCTADRPPELRDWGAGQTIDQVGIYGTNVRWFADLPVPSDWTEPAARMAAMRAHELSAGPRRGPVHLNWPLRKPLEPVADVPVRQYDPVDGRAAAAEPPRFASTPSPDRLGDLAGHERGVIVVGPDAAMGLEDTHRLVDSVGELAAALAWPVIAEPLSGMRESGTVVANAEHLLKHDAVIGEMRPDVVVRFGAAPTTAPVDRWLAAVRPEHVVLVDPEQRWHDASFTTTRHVVIDPQRFATASRPGEVRTTSAWLDRWRALDAAAGGAVDGTLADVRRTSGSVVRDLCDGLPEGSVVMSSNSMPPRDLDSFVPAGTSLTFVGNRGASGIDGITSTALGIASQIHGEVPVVVFTGDLALLHDIGGLLGVARAGEHLTVVCIDNDGGQIFSMLPIHGRIADDTYDTIFRTPHGVDLAQLDGLAGIAVTVVDEHDDLHAAVATATTNTQPGVDLLIVRIDPDHDMAVRAAIRTAVGEAISQ